MWYVCGGDTTDEAAVPTPTAESYDELVRELNRLAGENNALISERAALVEQCNALLHKCARLKHERNNLSRNVLPQLARLTKALDDVIAERDALAARVDCGGAE